MFRFFPVVVMVAFLTGCGEQKYPSGRDTYRAFDDGRFDIGWFSDGMKSLTDGETGLTLLSNVYDYRRTREVLYFVGLFKESISLVVITRKDGAIHRYRTINEVGNPVWKSQLKRLDPSKRLGNIAPLWD